MIPETLMRTARASLNLDLADYSDTYCNSKIVFADLEAVLAKHGVKIQAVETRADGRGSPPALRIRTSARPPKHYRIQTDLRLIEHRSGAYTHKVVFLGLESELKKQGLNIELCSTRSHKQGSVLALRVKVA
jgi:hypothetical protein